MLLKVIIARPQTTTVQVNFDYRTEMRGLQFSPVKKCRDTPGSNPKNVSEHADAPPQPLKSMVSGSASEILPIVLGAKLLTTVPVYSPLRAGELTAAQGYNI